MQTYDCVYVTVYPPIFIQKNSNILFTTLSVLLFFFLLNKISWALLHIGPYGASPFLLNDCIKLVSMDVSSFI